MSIRNIDKDYYNKSTRQALTLTFGGAISNQKVAYFSEMNGVVTVEIPQVFGTNSPQSNFNCAIPLAYRPNRPTDGAYPVYVRNGTDAVGVLKVTNSQFTFSRDIAGTNFTGGQQGGLPFNITFSYYK